MSYIHYSHSNTAPVINENEGVGGLYSLENDESAANIHGSNRYEYEINGEIAGPRELEIFLNENDHFFSEIFNEDLTDEDKDIMAEMVIEQSTSFDGDERAAEIMNAIDISDFFVEMHKLIAKTARAAGYAAVIIDDEYAGETVLLLDATIINI